jgi:hypothetical protein
MADKLEKSSVEKRAFGGQENPKDQAKVIIWSARGSLSNLEDKITFYAAIDQMNDRLDELELLVKTYMPEKW